MGTEDDDGSFAARSHIRWVSGWWILPGLALGAAFWFVLIYLLLKFF